MHGAARQVLHDVWLLLNAGSAAQQTRGLEESFVVLNSAARPQASQQPQPADGAASGLDAKLQASTLCSCRSVPAGLTFALHADALSAL
jgi:hypothetical protein